VFTRTDFTRLALRLSRISGRFMLSVNDVPQTREIFGRFAIETVATSYTVSGKWSDVTEILVTGPSRDHPLPVVQDLLSL
jgi:DNA adenine methylase